MSRQTTSRVLEGSDENHMQRASSSSQMPPPTPLRRNKAPCPTITTIFNGHVGGGGSGPTPVTTPGAPCGLGGAAVASGPPVGKLGAADGLIDG